MSLGIDLGTSNSSAAYISDNNDIEMIKFENGKTTIPSIVEYNENKILVGERAKNHICKNSSNVLYNSKKIIGRKIDNIKKELSKYPFIITENDNHDPVYFVDEKYIYPEDVSTEILKYIFECSKKQHPDIENVVITVPAYFDFKQRLLTKEAGQKAGLNVINLINEPTAAAICYIYDGAGIEGNILIYDLGGGTFDVSLIEINGTNIRVLATGGNGSIGGEDFTDRLLNYVVDEAKKKGINYDILSDKEEEIKRVSRLRKKIEEEKTNLSEIKEVSIPIKSDIEDEIIITRDIFNRLCSDLIDNTIKTINDTLETVDNKSIKNILLVGGSSRIPLIETKLIENFDNIVLSNCNVMEVVAKGAAYYAYSSISDEYEKYNISDILNCSIGILALKNDNHLYYKMIEKGSKIPCEREFRCKNSDMATNAKVCIYKGESENIEEDTEIGSILVNLEPKERGKIDIEIKIRVNSDGTIKVIVTADENIKESTFNLV